MCFCSRRKLRGALVILRHSAEARNGPTCTQAAAALTQGRQSGPSVTYYLIHGETWTQVRSVLLPVIIVLDHK